MREGDERALSPDGFPGERIRVLPRPLVRRMLAAPTTSALLVTDAGYFPRAAEHARSRPDGSAEAVVLFCAGGAGRVRVGGARTIVVEPGMALVLAPGRPHEYAADEANPWTLWWMHVGGSLAIEWCALVGAGDQPAVRHVTDPFAVTSLFDEILRHMERDTTTASLLGAAGAAWHLLARLAASRVDHGSAGDAIERTAEYLREHFADDITVGELAAMAGFSASHFATRFRRQLGQSVHRYQSELRMSRARELLDTTSLPISEVSRLVGFDDPFYFSRRFRAVHSQTPQAFRRRLVEPVVVSARPATAD